MSDAVGMNHTQNKAGTHVSHRPFACVHIKLGNENNSGARPSTLRRTMQGRAARLARRVHTAKVAGSNPASATRTVRRSSSWQPLEPEPMSGRNFALVNSAKPSDSGKCTVHGVESHSTTNKAEHHHQPNLTTLNRTQPLSQTSAKHASSVAAATSQKETDLDLRSRPSKPRDHSRRPGDGDIDERIHLPSFGVSDLTSRGGGTPVPRP